MNSGQLGEFQGRIQDLVKGPYQGKGLNLDLFANQYLFQKVSYLQHWKLLVDPTWTFHGNVSCVTTQN